MKNREQKVVKRERRVSIAFTKVVGCLEVLGKCVVIFIVIEISAVPLAEMALHTHTHNTVNHTKMNRQTKNTKKSIHKTEKNI